MQNYYICVIYSHFIVSGDIGGSMGLFIGGSLITIFELFDVVILFFMRISSTQHHESNGSVNGRNSTSTDTIITTIWDGSLQEINMTLQDWWLKSCWRFQIFTDITKIVPRKQNFNIFKILKKYWRNNSTFDYLVVNGFWLNGSMEDAKG